MNQRYKTQENYGWIYIFINLLNGKMYIGQTTRLKDRLNQHLRNEDNGYFSNALKKYGLKNFKLLTISYPIAELDYWETFYIKEFNTKKINGYNLTDGGSGMRGYVLTEAHKRKTSKTLKGRILTQKHREKIANALRGVPLTEKRKINISKSKWKKVLVFNINNECISEFECPQKAADYYNVSRSSIIKICEGINKRNKNGLRFEYVKEQ